MVADKPGTRRVNRNLLEAGIAWLDVQTAGKHEGHEGVEGEVVIPSVRPGFIHDASSSSGFHQSKSLGGFDPQHLGFVRVNLPGFRYERTL